MVAVVLGMLGVLASQDAERSEEGLLDAYLMRTWRRALVLVAAVGFTSTKGSSMKRLLLPAMALVSLALLFVVPSAFAQATGAEANKDCPGLTASPGDTIICNFNVQNTGQQPAVITELVEISPDPGGAPVDISCTAGGVTYDEGDTIPNGVVCSGTFSLTVPNDPALCGTAITDRVQIALRYDQFTPPLTAGAFATHTTLIACPADISVVKTADTLSKVGDPVNYTITVTNNGAGVATRTSVNDSLLGDISASFAATLAPGASSTATFSRTVLAGDSDPLVNTVTAIYSSGASSDTATASASTNLFQPAVTLDKSADVASGVEGSTVNYTIVASNTGSADSPNCVGNVVDAVLGINQAVSIAPGASVTITAAHVLAATPDPLVNTATLTCSPAGFPNVLTASDSVTVDVLPPPPGGEGCTPGFWKQDQHFDSWVGFAPSDSFEDVFGVDVTLRSGGQGTISDPTLLDALNATGGGINALARHAVAALLNASSPDVDSDFTTAQVIALVQAAVASGDFETAHQLLAASNEEGCPLS
jgi:uncharacterized repeat protein (TIGR01451 family)